MKKWIMPLIVVLMFASLLLADMKGRENPLSNYFYTLLTEGTASFSVRTATYNGPYAPRNAGVIWVTNSNNQFVKTIKIWAATYRYTLIRWIASSGQNTTGAITSASLNNHQMHNIQWNGTDWQNNSMPDGEYKFNIEFTEHNASAANMGKFKQVTFTKGPDPVDLTIPNETYFRDMTLTWTPVIVDGTLEGTVTDSGGSPIANAFITTGAQSLYTNGQGFYSFTLAPGTYNLLCTATGYLDYSVDNIVISSGQNSVVDINLTIVSNMDLHNVSPAIVFAPISPNPTKTEAKLSFFSGFAADYSVQIYNQRGQLLRRIRGTKSKSGWENLIWDGRDEAGKHCPNGLYITKLKIGTQVVSQKLTILR